MNKIQESRVDVALLVIRLALGVVFLAHGLDKFGFLGGGAGMVGFTSYLESLRIPLPAIMAYIVAGGEVAGGVLVLAGLFSRIAALGLLGIMIVACLKVHITNGFFLDSARGVGFEYVMVLGGMALSLVLAGEGRFSIGAVVPIFRARKETD